MDESHRNTVSLRGIISGGSDDLLIYSADPLSQPHRRQLRQINPMIYTKCSRPLGACTSDDLVVLSGTADMDYYQWLRSVGLGPDCVVQYGEGEGGQTLSQLIQRDPSEIIHAIKSSNKHPVYVPYYSGDEERRCANRLGADLFGADGEIVQRYFNKITFKQLCRSLDVPVVDGVVFELDFRNPANLSDFKSQLRQLGDGDHGIMVRGEYGSGGSALYLLTLQEADAVYRRMQDKHEGRILIERVCDVESSPTDHWAITSDRRVIHIDRTLQILDRCVHKGSVCGASLDGAVRDKIHRYSSHIVEHMAKDGYVGWIGIDYIVDRQGMIFVTENNARMCESTFVFGILDNLRRHVGEIPFWKMMRIKVNCPSFVEFLDKTRSIIYAPNGSTHCIFPYDCGMLPTSGVLSMILVAEDAQQAAALESRMQVLLQ